MKRNSGESAGDRPGRPCRRRGLLFLSLAAAMTAVSLPALAQTPTPTPASAPPQKKPFSPAELDQILAPIALYDDALLSQVLMAATYPLEIVEAARWQQANPGPTGDAAVAAVADKTWDVSVKSLVAFPSVLKQMNEHLDWTQKLGDAFLAQQQEVLATAQSLRQKATAEGSLKDSKEQKVVTTTENNTTVIKIEPTNPEVVYVPTYNPTVVYGAWPYPTYPPYYWYPPGYVAGGALLGFTAGVIVGGALWGNCNWRGGDVNVNVNRYNNFNRTNVSNGNWSHNVNHRGAVPYRDQGVAKQYGRGQAGDAASRDAFRGRAEAGQGAIQRGEVNARDVGNRGQSAATRDMAAGRDMGGGSRDFSNRGASASAFDTRGGAQTRDYSNRGASSMSSARSAGNMGGGAARSGGGGGGARGGGGGGGGGRGGRR